MLIPTLTTESPGNFLTAALWNGTVVGGLQALQGPVLFSAYSTVGQSIAGSGTGVTTSKVVQFDTEVIDTDGGHSTTTNNSRYVVQTAGVFLCFGSVTYTTASSTGTRAAEILKNGAALPGGIQQGAAPSNHGASVGCFTMVRCAVGDYLELGTWQDSGATDTLASTSAHLYPAVNIIRVSN